MRIPIEDIRAIEAIAARHGWRIEVNQSPARGAGSAVFTGHWSSGQPPSAPEVIGPVVRDAREPEIGQKLSDKMLAAIKKRIRNRMAGQGESSLGFSTKVSVGDGIGGAGTPGGVEKIPVRWRSMSVPVPADRLGKFVRQPVMNPEEQQVILGFETLHGDVIRLVLCLSEARTTRDVLIEAIDRAAGLPPQPYLCDLLTGDQPNKASGKSSVDVSMPEDGAGPAPASNSSSPSSGEK